MFQKLARICLYAVPLVVVAVLPTTFFPFIGVKYYLFRALVTLALSFTVLGWAFENEPISLKERAKAVFTTPAGIGFLVVTAAILLATAFAYDPRMAFWSNYERGEGSFMFLHYLAFFGLCAALLTERAHWRVMMRVSLVAAVGVALYGVCAAISPAAFVGPYGDPAAGSTFLHRLFLSGQRFQGSLGNAAYVTPYFAFIAAYVGWLWTGAQTRLKAAALGILGLIFAGLFFVLSGTRGAFVGLLAGLFVGAITYAWRVRKHRRIILGLMLAGALAFSGLLVLRNNPHIVNLPGARFLQLDFGQLTAQTRFWTWGSAWKGFKDRPILGYGPENFTVAFDAHFDKRHFVPGQNAETWFDRAHNIVLDYLATTGLVGFLAWLSFIVLVFVQVRRAIRAQTLRPMQEAILIGVPVMYVVQSLLLFDVLPIFMNLALFAAIAVVAGTAWKQDQKHHAHAGNH